MQLCHRLDGAESSRADYETQTAETQLILIYGEGLHLTIKHSIRSASALAVQPSKTAKLASEFDYQNDRRMFFSGDLHNKGKSNISFRLERATFD